ncbi:hypothetical protein [Pararcticibacter amylolyticus]|uniref:DUF3575 domain-containing protein n=1 Tax=Pararcticibacter amylolyticus TaxID=2173175 RepID=A0A2U2PFY1_9SPHI|nr:hypothetical protein [Pararcticibacter amylolyticus]PWG80315.1 hypothetical protein DDR33_11915 [Pararcticibacter amylolyticus]
MKRYFFYVILLLLVFQDHLLAQEAAVIDSGEQKMPHFKAGRAFEVESLFPMFFTGGYHAAIGYRYGKIRLRISIINGGKCNAEPAGVKNSREAFKRFYKTSPGIFLGYNVWRNLEVYTFLEMHTFKIEQKLTGMSRDLRSDDFGGGLSYQFFFGRHLYLQPGLHLYLRSDGSADFNGERYDIPRADLSPVIRIGWRIWEKK